MLIHLYQITIHTARKTVCYTMTKIPYVIPRQKQIYNEKTLRSEIGISHVKYEHFHIQIR